VTRVKVADDLSIADVYVTVMGTPGHQRAALNALRHSAGLMRTRLTKALSIRQTPFIKFHLDEIARKEIEVLELLHKVSLENAEKDRQRALAAQGEQPASSQEQPGGLPPSIVNSATDNGPLTPDP
jgi:hypothetical protein